jgi:hypothetical protein
MLMYTIKYTLKTYRGIHMQKIFLQNWNYIFTEIVYYKADRKII